MESKQPWFNPFSWSRTSLDLSDTGSTQIYMILTPPPSNTLILITQHTSRPLAAPIVARLRDSSTLIRTSADPSFLLYALLDCIVDHSVLLIRSYQARMAELEAAVFQKARSGYTRDLQFLRGEIQGIRIAVAPLRGVVAQLRMTRQGVKVGTPTAGEEEEEGVDGLWKSSEGMQTEGELGIGAAEKTGLGFAFALTAGTFGTDSLFAAAGAAQMLGPDLVSPLSKLFFGDVLDHISTVLDVVDMLERSAGDLIDLIFNTIATQTNDNMRILAIVSIIFLPCTFLTGFYGMNIPPEAFPELEVAGGTRTVWIILAATTMLTLLVFWMMGMLECECCYASGEMMRRRKRAKAMERGWR